MGGGSGWVGDSTFMGDSEEDVGDGTEVGFVGPAIGEVGGVGDTLAEGGGDFGVEGDAGVGFQAVAAGQGSEEGGGFVGRGFLTQSGGEVSGRA